VIPRFKDAIGFQTNIPAPGAGNGQAVSPNLQVTSASEIKLAKKITIHFWQHLLKPFVTSSYLIACKSCKELNQFLKLIQQQQTFQLC
jgi:hypothetical protein